MSKNKDKIISIAILSTIILGIGAFFYHFFKDYVNDKNEEFVSEEGTKVLNDPTKKEKLEKAIEEFKASGEWKRLETV